MTPLPISRFLSRRINDLIDSHERMKHRNQAHASLSSFNLKMILCEIISRIPETKTSSPNVIYSSSLAQNLPTSQTRAYPVFEVPLPSPTLKQRGSEARIIRVSMDNEHGNGNLYRSIVITSQDKTTAVVQRALQKHNLEGDTPGDYQLLQLLEDGQELLIPGGSNVFYAMNPTGPHDFLLCRKKGATKARVLGVVQASHKTAPQRAVSLKDCGTKMLSSTSCPTSFSSTPNLASPSPERRYPSLLGLDPEFRPNLLAPSFPPSPSWSLGIQAQSVPLESPLPSPTLTHLETMGSFRPALPNIVLPSSLQNPEASAPLPQSPPHYSSEPCFWSKSSKQKVVHHLSAP
nr:uncharacterized protein LOC132763797 [Anolis sagrei ordinatus]